MSVNNIIKVPIATKTNYLATNTSVYMVCNNSPISAR